MRLDLALLLFLFLPLAAHSSPIKVAIDAGHGGKDHGAVEGELKESAITWQISQKLSERLGHDARFKPVLLRSRDEFLSLEQRVARAEQRGVDLFLSVHVNWSDDKRAQGVEIYFQNQLPADEESMFLAARENQGAAQRAGPRGPASVAAKLHPEVHLIVQDLLRNHRIALSSEFAKSLKQHWRGLKKSSAHSVRQAPFFVISNLEVPSALVEIGFLSHPTEGPKLASETYQNIVAQSLHEGLINYQESLDKPKAPRLE